MSYYFFKYNTYIVKNNLIWGAVGGTRRRKTYRSILGKCDCQREQKPAVI